MHKIIIIEDDEAIQKELKVLLNNQGYACICWDLKQDIKQFLDRAEPQLILLDINLPQIDGFTLCTQIRTFSNVPIIFVTSRNTDIDELCSMSMGGDDFITKPYNTSILLARIGAIMKRTYGQVEQVLKHNDVILDVALSKISYLEQSIELTKNEVRVLHYLFLHKGTIVQRDDLIDYLWDNKLFIDDNALSVNVTRIRAKLKELGIEDFIKTKHRQGYVI